MHRADLPCLRLGPHQRPVPHCPDQSPDRSTAHISTTSEYYWRQASRCDLVAGTRSW